MSALKRRMQARSRDRASAHPVGSSIVAEVDDGFEPNVKQVISRRLAGRTAHGSVVDVVEGHERHVALYGFGAGSFIASASRMHAIAGTMPHDATSSI